MNNASCFDHERLDVYIRAIELVAWTSRLLLIGCRQSAVKQLGRACTSIALNVAEGNGKRSRIDRCRFLDIARGSALESAACLDVLVATGFVDAERIAAGKALLVRIVSMLSKMVLRLIGSASGMSPRYEHEHEHVHEHGE